MQPLCKSSGFHLHRLCVSSCLFSTVEASLELGELGGALLLQLLNLNLMRLAGVLQLVLQIFFVGQ